MFLRDTNVLFTDQYARSITDINKILTFTNLRGLINKMGDEECKYEMFCVINLQIKGPHPNLTSNIKHI